MNRLFHSKILMLFLAILSLLISSKQIYAQNYTLPDNDLKRVKSYFESNLGSKYMETACSPTSYSGWDNLPLVRCTYTVKGSRDAASKTAEIIMLNPSPEQLARWVVYTCLEIVGNAENQCTSKLSQHIIYQSGAQFPIAGIVFEDIIPEDGRYEIYAFRNGVTVKIDGVNHRGTKQPSAEEIEESIDGKVTHIFQYVRLQGTTPEQYKANGGQEDVGDSSKPKMKWLEVIRDLYKSAWGQDRNELMIAWARANVNQLK